MFYHFTLHLACQHSRSYSMLVKYNLTGLMRENNNASVILKTCMSARSSLWTEIDILEKAIYKMKSKWRLEPLFRGTKQVRPDL